MDFWKKAYDNQWVGIDMLRQAVITETNPFGDITKEQFKEITVQEF